MNNTHTTSPTHTAVPNDNNNIDQDVNLSTNVSDTSTNTENIVVINDLKKLPTLTQPSASTPSTSSANLVEPIVTSPTTTNPQSTNDATTIPNVVQDEPTVIEAAPSTLQPSSLLSTTTISPSLLNQEQIQCEEKNEPQKNDETQQQQQQPTPQEPQGPQGPQQVEKIVEPTTTNTSTTAVTPQKPVETADIVQVVPITTRASTGHSHLFDSEKGRQCKQLAIENRQRRQEEAQRYREQPSLRRFTRSRDPQSKTALQRQYMPAIIEKPVEKPKKEAAKTTRKKTTAKTTSTAKTAPAANLRAHPPTPANIDPSIHMIQYHHHHHHGVIPANVPPNGTQVVVGNGSEYMGHNIYAQPGQYQQQTLSYSTSMPPHYYPPAPQYPGQQQQQQQQQQYQYPGQQQQYQYPGQQQHYPSQTHPSTIDNGSRGEDDNDEYTQMTKRHRPNQPPNPFLHHIQQQQQQQPQPSSSLHPNQFVKLYSGAPTSIQDQLSAQQQQQQQQQQSLYYQMPGTNQQQPQPQPTIGTSSLYIQPPPSQYANVTAASRVTSAASARLPTQTPPQLPLQSTNALAQTNPNYVIRPHMSQVPLLAPTPTSIQQTPVNLHTPSNPFNQPQQQQQPQSISSSTIPTGLTHPRTQPLTSGSSFLSSHPLIAQPSGNNITSIPVLLNQHIVNNNTNYHNNGM